MSLGGRVVLEAEPSEDSHANITSQYSHRSRLLPVTISHLDLCSDL